METPVGPSSCPRMRASTPWPKSKTWTAGTSPAMTAESSYAPSRHHLAQRRDFQGIELVADRARDEARRDRRAVIVQHRHEANGIDAALVDDERAQLGVAVLLDHEDEIVVGDEARHARMEREGAHAQPVDQMALGLDHVDRLVHRG